MVNFINIIKNDPSLCPICYNKCSPNYKVYESEYAFLANDEDAQKLFFSKASLTKKECTECAHAYVITQKKNEYNSTVVINIPLRDFINLEEKYVYQKKKQSLEKYLPEGLKKQYSLAIETLQSTAPEEAKRPMIKALIEASLKLENKLQEAENIKKQGDDHKDEEQYIAKILPSVVGKTLKTVDIKINEAKIKSKDALELLELHFIKKYKIPKRKEEVEIEYQTAIKDIKSMHAKELENIENEISEQAKVLKPLV